MQNKKPKHAQQFEAHKEVINKRECKIIRMLANGKTITEVAKEILVSKRMSLRAVIRVRKGAICTVLIVKTLLSVDAFLFVNCDIIVTIILKSLNSYVYKIISLEFVIFLEYNY
jgi:hypothetical protein